MSKDEAFRILGIEPTDDKKIIKKAYAQLVKKYHPEEQPDEWQRVRNAYEAASGNDGSYLYTGRILSVDISERILEEKQKGTLPEEDKELEEIEDVFHNLSDLSAQERAQRYEEDKLQSNADKPVLMAAISEVAMLRYKRMQKTKDWKRIFENEEYKRIFIKEEFLAECRRSLYYAVISRKLYRYLKNFMKQIRQYSQSVQIGAIDAEWEAVCEQVENDIEDAYIITKLKRIVLNHLGKILLISVVLIFIICGMIEGQRQKAAKAAADAVYEEIMEQNLREINQLPSIDEYEMDRRSQEWMEQIEKQKENE